MIPHTRSSSQVAAPLEGRIDALQIHGFWTRGSRNGKSPAVYPSPASRRSAELSCNESHDRSTEGFRLLERLGLGQDPNNGLGSRGPDQHAAGSVQLLVAGGDLVEHRRRKLLAPDGHVFLRLRI